MAHTRTHQKSDGLVVFYLLVLTLSFLIGGSMILFQIPGGTVLPGSPLPPVYGLLLLLIYVFLPSTVGVIMTWRMEGRAGLRTLWRRTTHFRLGLKPLAIILLLPLGFVAASIILRLARGGAIATSPLFASPLLLVGFLVQVFLFGPLSEELGWRGFALDRLLARTTPLKASLVHGVIWAFWHLPAFFIPGTIQQSWGNPVLEYSIFACAVISSSFIFTWLHLNTWRSVWAAILYHTTANLSLNFLQTLYPVDLPNRILYTLLMGVLPGILLAFFSLRKKSISRETNHDTGIEGQL